jgi:hypothetical protein
MPITGLRREHRRRKIRNEYPTNYKATVKGS